jgi:hypothetical protein
MASETKGRNLFGEVEVDGCYVGGIVRPANRKEDRVDCACRKIAATSAAS